MAASSSVASSTAAATDSPSLYVRQVKKKGPFIAFPYNSSRNIGTFFAQYCEKKGLSAEDCSIFLVKSGREVEAGALPPWTPDSATPEFLTKLDGTELVSEGRFVVVLDESVPSSTTGKCPHSIVFPSVARSSLTCSRCFVSPVDQSCR
jgi:hypothetical protein